MEYVFGNSTKNGELVENLKTISSSHTELSGYISLIKEFPDGTKIEDKCKIVKKYSSRKVDALYYDWYYVTDHYRNIDVTKKIKTYIEKLYANLDYLSMMVNIDIPEDGELKL